MDIVGIERESFDSFKKKLERIAEISKNKYLPATSTIEQEWIENTELAHSLNVKSRYLQSLRERGKLAFTTIGKKIYYRINDVKSLIEKRKSKE